MFHYRYGNGRGSWCATWNAGEVHGAWRACSPIIRLQEAHLRKDEMALRQSLASSPSAGPTAEKFALLIAGGDVTAPVGGST
jgi:hypothetical protein